MSQRVSERLKSLRNILVGIALAILTCLALKYLSPFKDLDVLAAMLIGAGVLYFGSSLTAGRQKTVLLEGVVAALVIAMGLLGEWFSPFILALGYFIHGSWDYSHRWLRIGAPVRAGWFAELCLSYDWFMAVYIVVKYGYL